MWKKLLNFLKIHKGIVIAAFVNITCCIIAIIIMFSMTKSSNKLVEEEMKKKEAIYNKQLEAQINRIDVTLAPIEGIKEENKNTTKRVDGIEKEQKKLLSSLSKLNVKYNEKIKYNSSTPFDVTDSILSKNLRRDLSSPSNY